MGSTLSFTNNTDDVIMVKLTANTKVIAPIVTSFVAIAGAAVTALTAGAASGIAVAGTTISYAALAAGGTAASAAIAKQIATTVLNDFENDLVSGYEREGFKKVMPGKKWKGPKQTLSLNQRLWAIRFTKGASTMTIRTANSSVWTGATDGSNINYKASNSKYFKWKTQDTYNLKRDDNTVRGGAIGDVGRGGAIDPPQGGSRLVGLAVGYLLTSGAHTLNKSIGGMAGINKRGTIGNGFRPIAALDAPKTDFAVKMSDILGDKNEL